MRARDAGWRLEVGMFCSSTSSVISRLLLKPRRASYRARLNRRVVSGTSEFRRGRLRRKVDPSCRLGDGMALVSTHHPRGAGAVRHRRSRGR